MVEKSRTESQGYKPDGETEVADENRNKVPSNMSRTAFAAKNSLFGLLGKIMSLIANFASRTVFIYVLGQYYLGINGLYTDVLSILSFAELGFGSAMVFSLYGPVACDDSEKIRQLMGFYKVVYRIVALVVFMAGLVMLPFLQYVVTGADSLSLYELRLYFLIFLANTVTTYFVTYKYGLLNAMQKTYVTTNVETIASFACVCAQIAVLLLTGNFLLYLLANTATLIISRFIIAAYLNKKYPLLSQKPKTPLSIKDRKGILHEVKGLAVHQLSSVAVHSTDSIIIAAIPALGVAVVGAVSNYNLIINAIGAMVIIVLNGVVAGFGNLAVTSDKAKFRSVFDEANFASFWIYGVCSACLFTLITPFIRLWAGESYVIDEVSLSLILINFYLQGQCTIYNNVRIAKGHFNMDKWWSLLQAAVNLIVSIVCALQIGLAGVFAGTVVSRLVFVVARPCSTYRFLFGEPPKRYFSVFLKYLEAVVLAAAVCGLLCRSLPCQGQWIGFVGSALACLIVSNAIFFILFGRCKEMKALKTRVAGLVGGKRA